VGTKIFNLVTLTLMLKTLTLPITFEWYVLGQDLSVGTKIFDLVTLTLMFDLLIKNFNLAYNF
jgi:hypothetical protein